MNNSLLLSSSPDGLNFYNRNDGSKDVSTVFRTMNCYMSVIVKNTGID
jgi:hypothetical protein